MSDESHFSAPARTETEIAAELTVLTKQQSEARESRIFIGWNTAETAAYKSRTKQIRFLQNLLFEFSYRQAG
jgi:hypothetical protein